MNDSEVRAGIEVRLRKILDAYANAASAGDFKDAILGIHTAVEEALDLEFAENDRPESFGEKVQGLYPDLYAHYNINDLARLRNHIAHPKRIFQEDELRHAARDFVDFTLAAWPDLFGRQPPVILHPGIAQTPPAFNTAGSASPLPPPPPPLGDFERAPVPYTYEEPVPYPHAEEPQTAAAASTPRGRLPEWLKNLLHLPWHHLLYSFASAWMAVMGVGLMVQISDTSSTTTLLLIGIAALIFAIACLGYMVHFVLRFGILRSFVVILSLLLVTSAFFIIRQPAGTRLPARLVEGFGQALISPLFWTNQIGQLAYESGQEFGQRYFPESRMVTDFGEEETDSTYEQLMQTLFPAGEPEIPTAPPPAATEEPRAGGIYIGGSVQVTARLNSRDAPGLSGSVVHVFPVGETLLVLDGPVQADDYTWWKVQSGSQTGWSAENFMTPVE
jgi:hypothetical protein